MSREGLSGAATREAERTPLPWATAAERRVPERPEQGGYQRRGEGCRDPAALTISTWWRPSKWSPLGRGQGKVFGEAHEDLGVIFHIDLQRPFPAS